MTIQERRDCVLRMTENNEALCVALVQGNCCTIRMFAEHFSIDKETVRTIITADLGGGGRRGECVFHSAIRTC